MAAASNVRNRLKALAVLSIFALVAGCGGEDEPGDGAGLSRDSGLIRTNEGELFENQVSGSVGDGPIVGATLVIRSVSGQELMRAASDQAAFYDIVIKAKGKDYALTVQSEGGTDLVTNQAPDFDLLSGIIRPAKRSISNLNPFTTLIFKSARAAGGINDTTFAAARDAITLRYGYGLDPLLVADPTASPIDDQNVAVIVKSSETLGEMIRRTRDALVASGVQIDGNGVVDVLSADLVDGYIDGRGASGTNARIAAVANAASAAVLVEAFANRLHVYGVDATGAMDAAIRQIRAGVSSKMTTASVRIPAAGFAQASRALLATSQVASDQVILDAVAVMEGATPGSLPADIAPRLPAGLEGALANAVTMAAFASDAEIEAVNAVARGETPSSSSTRSGSTAAPNQPPTIAGTVPSEAVVGKAWTFSPEATDPDGDALTFAIENQPPWTNFDPASGRLWGTPTVGDAGEHIVVTISVSDGEASATLNPFEIVVRDVAPTGQATVRWTPPTLRVDGTALDGLSGYTIHYGQTPDGLTKTVKVADPSATSFAVSDLATGTWYFAVSARDVQGLESGLSNVASKYVE